MYYEIHAREHLGPRVNLVLMFQTLVDIGIRRLDGEGVIAGIINKVERDSDSRE